MSNRLNFGNSRHKDGVLVWFAKTQVTPENAQRTVLVGSALAALTVQTLTKDGLDGAIFGAGAGITGLLTVVCLLATPVSLPVVVFAGIAGSLLGVMHKPTRERR